MSPYSKGKIGVVKPKTTREDIRGIREATQRIKAGDDSKETFDGLFTLLDNLNYDTVLIALEHFIEHERQREAG